jgi:hypothetical protein
MLAWSVLRCSPRIDPDGMRKVMESSFINGNTCPGQELHP